MKLGITAIGSNRISADLLQRNTIYASSGPGVHSRAPAVAFLDRDRGSRSEHERACHEGVTLSRSGPVMRQLASSAAGGRVNLT
jgi:hypothetical protein